MVRGVLGRILRKMQENITENFQSTGSMSFPATPSPTPVAAAISTSATISANPSSALTNAAVVVTTTTITETNGHIHNASVYLAENDELEYSEYSTNKETARQYRNSRLCKQTAVPSRKLNPSLLIMVL